MNRTDTFRKEVRHVLESNILNYWLTLKDPNGGFYGEADSAAEIQYTAPRGAILNARIDRQEPLRLRLRKVSADAATAVWREMRGGRKDVAVSRDGNDAIVEIPSLSAWNWGWLAL